jgi:carboxypeptidase PM20D1
MVRKILLGAALLLLLLIAVILFRTFTYGKSTTADAVSLPAVPEISADLAAQHLGEAIRFKTVTVSNGDPRPGQEGEWLRLHDWMSATYPAANAVMSRELVPGTFTILYTWQGSDPSLRPLLLMAHQDVVPVNIGTEKDWDAPAFDGEIKNGFIYGRGAIDDKGSLVALMEAADALARDGFMPKRTLHFLFGHDEEVSGSGAEAGVELLKSRAVAPEFALDEGFMIVNPSPLTGKPTGFIGVAEKGFMTVKLTIVDAGGHSSTPPRESGAVRLARALVALEENQMPANFSKPPVKELFASTAKDMGFVQRMAFANLWLFRGMVEGELAKSGAGNAMVRTTTAPTMLEGSAKENVLPQRAAAYVNFRIHPNDTEEDVLNHIKRVTTGIRGLEIEVARAGDRGNGASNVSPTDTRGYQVLASVAQKTGGASVAPGLVLGGTDGRYAEAITANVYRFAPAILTPEELSGFHGTNERTSVHNMKRMSEGYARIILAMDAPE